MQSFLHAFRTFCDVFLDALMFISLHFKSTTSVAAENLFLRKQLGLFVERKVKPHRATDAIPLYCGQEFVGDALLAPNRIARNREEVDQLECRRSGNVLRAMKDTDSSFMIGTASILKD